MCEDPPYDRRRFLGITAMTIAATHLGTRDVAHAQSRTTPPAALPTMKPGTHTSFDALKQIEAGVLNVGYAEAGPAAGPAVLLLHGCDLETARLLLDRGGGQLRKALALVGQGGAHAA